MEAESAKLRGKISDLEGENGELRKQIGDLRKLYQRFVFDSRDDSESGSLSSGAEVAEMSKESMRELLLAWCVSTGLVDEHGADAVKQAAADFAGR